VIGEFYEEIGLPPLLRVLCRQNVLAGGGDQVIPIPFVWQMMCASPRMEAGKDWWDAGGEDEMIGDLYACAFDKHTQEGKRANAYFLKACPGAANFLAKHCKGHPVEAMGEPVFTAEGGLLRPRLKFEGAKQVFDTVFAAYMEKDGWNSTEAATQFCKLLQANLPLLNHARRRVLGLL
jgi:hypothetical protein